MTPQEFIQARRKQNEIIDACMHVIYIYQLDAEKCPIPERLRPAVAGDIVEGAVIWYKHGDDGPFWQIVSQVHCPGDAFKAYTAEDGCRYGLDDAFVEVDLS